MFSMRGSLQSQLEKEILLNINDVPIGDLFATAARLYKTRDPYEIIFARQRELMERYLPIEAEILGRPKLSVPVDIHSAVGQAAIKERAWWFVEELAEALEALEDGMSIKVLEEFSDAIHFLTEAMILSGIPYQTDPIAGLLPRFWILPKPYLTKKVLMKLRTLSIITQLGMAMWQLRNKSWKRTQTLTDIPQYQEKMLRTWGGLMALLKIHWEMSREEITILYLRKATVNQFRIRSHY